MSEELIIILITYDTYDFAITFFQGQIQWSWPMREMILVITVDNRYC